MTEDTKVIIALLILFGVLSLGAITIRVVESIYVCS